MIECPVCHTVQAVEIEGVADAWLWPITDQNPAEVPGYDEMTTGQIKWWCHGCGIESSLDEHSALELYRSLLLGARANAHFAKDAMDAFMKSHLEGDPSFLHHFDANGIYNAWVPTECDCPHCLAHPVGNPAYRQYP